MTASTEPTMLIVEDCPEDYEATVRMLKKSGWRHPHYRCEDGEEALDFLFHRGDYRDAGQAPRPSLILLDLNLPGTDGREVLAEIKQDEDLRSIPVLVFTTSNLEGDVHDCYRSGANSYIKKPIDREGYRLALHRLKEYWCDLVILPPVA